MSRGLVNNMLTMNNLGDGSTLSLDFTTMGGVLDPRLTFSRASTATFVNSSGYVEWAGANLARYSQQITTTNWATGGNTTLTLNTTEVLDPQGGNTATKISLAANAYCSRAQDIALPGGQTYTFSFWIRGTAGVTCRIYSFAGYVGDLVTETAYSYSTSAWTRVSTTFTTNAATTNVFVYVCSKGTAPASTDVIYVWGAQLNPGSTAQTYYPTTTAAYHAPRFDYSPTNIGEPRGLLIEGSSINYMLQSTTLSQTAFSMRANTTASITDPEGTTTNAKTVGADGTYNYHLYYLPTTAGTNTVVTVSIFAKKNGYKYLYLSDVTSGRSAVRFDLDNGTTSNSAGAGFASATATPYPNGWWRCSMVANVVASTSYGWSYGGVPTTGASLNAFGAAYTGANTDSDGIYCYGFQVEAGSGASSYIPTGASQVTRNTDLLAVTSTTTMGLNTSAGTFFVETELPRAGTTSPAQFGTPYANGSWLGQFYGGTEATTLTANWWGGSVLPLSRSGNPKSLTALSYGLYTGTSIPVSSSLNGAVSTGTFTTSGANNAPNPATWSFITLACNSTSSSLGTTSRDNFNGCIKRFKYYPTRLSDAQLQALTAP
jgi:hypothetical protein